MKTIRKIIILVIILMIGWNALPGAAQDKTGEFQLYLPILMRNYPYHPIFGVEITSSGFMDDAALAGNHWVRYNGLLWSEVQPDLTTQYLWETAQNLEADLQLASANGMEVILVVRSTPSWAQKYDGFFCGPMKEENIVNFANFMSNVVKRYSSPPFNVKYYEIWNEPDVDPYEHNLPITSPYGCWGDSKELYYGGEYYAKMLGVIYPAMKAANPIVNVVLGGLLLDCDPRSVGTGYCPIEERTKAPKFFEGILQNNGGSYFDVVSFHGYPTYQVGVNPIQSEINYSAWSAAGGVVAGKLDFINELMSQYGINKPIFHTEGALLLAKDESSSTLEFEKAKANYLPWLYARNWEKGIMATNWYTLNGPGWRQSALLTADQLPREAYTAFSLMTEKLGKAEFISHTILNDGTSNEIHRFDFLTHDMRIWLLFGTKDNNLRTVVIPPKFKQAYDVVRTPIILTDIDTQITFDRPIYIEMSK